METVTAGQAQWVLERLLADRRISPQDVQWYVADLGREIHDLERRLAVLRETAGIGPVASKAPGSAVATPKKGKRRPGRPKKRSGHPRGIAGIWLSCSDPSPQQSMRRSRRFEPTRASRLRSTRHEPPL